MFHYLVDSKAWQWATPQDRAVYMVLARIYNGTNNGTLGLGTREAAEKANINKDTAARSLKRLQECGLIECTLPASFNTNGSRAAEWRLTAHRCNKTNQPGSRAFQHWRPPESRTPSDIRAAPVRKQGTGG